MGELGDRGGVVEVDCQHFQAFARLIHAGLWVLALIVVEGPPLGSVPPDAE
jgi:hypothetical protein